MLKSERVYGLDIIRAIAVSLIVFGHAQFRSLGILKLQIFDGVNLFFVLSGFLIGTILIKTISEKFDTKELIKFWIKRWFRTLPAYIVVLTGIVIYSEVSPTYPIAKSVNYARFYFFLQSPFGLNGKADIFPEAWSLCIEEWFYLVIPLYLYFIKLIFNPPLKKLLLIVIISVIVIDTILRIRVCAIAHDFDTWNVTARQGTIYRLDSIMYGFLAAYLTYFKKWKGVNLLFVTGIIIWIVALVSFYIPFNAFFNYTFLTLQCIGTMLMMPYINNIKMGKGMVHKFITYVSTISYSLYLLNLTPYSIVVKHFDNRWLDFFGTIIFSFAGAHLLYKIIEQPFMNIRGKVISLIFPVKSKQHNKAVSE